MVIELDHTEKKNSHGVPIIPPESHAPGVELVNPNILLEWNLTFTENNQI